MRSQNANQMVDSGQTKIKVCGLYRDADIDAVNQYQPDYAGFVFYPPSHRYVTWEQMKDFREKLRGHLLLGQPLGGPFLSDDRTDLHGIASFVFSAV